MAYYKTCPYCGCNNDPGEVCDCQTEEKKRPPRCIGTTPGIKTPDAIITSGAAEIKEATWETR